MKTRYFILSISLIMVNSGLIYGQNSKNAESVTARQVIAEINKHTGNSAIQNTVDVIKFYVVGNPDMKLSNVRLAVGAPGSARHIMLLEDTNVEVVVAGEAQQWETYEYIRDAVDQGRNKAIVFLGHINSEEAGMDYCSSWLKSFIKSVPVLFVESGSSFWSY